MVYTDNAATTRLAPEALTAMMPYLQAEYGNASQPYSFSRTARKALKEAREMIAICINAEPENIFFTSGGTESDNWAIKGSMYLYDSSKSLITTQIEHHAVLHSAARVERMGYSVAYLPVDSSCTVQPGTLEDIISSNTRLVSVMMSNNEVGSIQPINELAIIAHEYGAVFHTDAVQTVGHITIDVKSMGVDMLSASAHKFNGPKGIGFLYVKENTPLFSFMDGGAQESGLRAGTENIASIVGMSVALKSNCEQMEKNQKYLRLLERGLIDGLRQTGLDFIRNGSDNRIPGNVSLSFKGADGEMLLHRLDLMGICVSTGSACDSKNTQISHVLRAMHVPEEYARGTIRISLGKDNTVDEVQTIVKCIKKILEESPGGHH